MSHHHHHHHHHGGFGSSHYGRVMAHREIAARGTTSFFGGIFYVPVLDANGQPTGQVDEVVRKMYNRQKRRERRERQAALKPLHGFMEFDWPGFLLIVGVIGGLFLWAAHQ